MNFSNQNKTFKVAVYIRLSRDDGDKQESESIGNQRDIIMRYIKENNLQFIDEYVDDGISGTTVANKRTNLSYKSKKRIKVSKEKYIVTENTHEPTIKKEDFEKVQFLLAKIR